MIIVDNVLMTAPVSYLPTFRVLSMGVVMIYQAPEIGLEVRYLPFGNKFFSVEVPEIVFYNMTEGLCGEYKLTPYQEQILMKPERFIDHNDWLVFRRFSWRRGKYVT